MIPPVMIYVCDDLPFSDDFLDIITIGDTILNETLGGGIRVGMFTAYAAHIGGMGPDDDDNRGGGGAECDAYHRGSESNVTTCDDTQSHRLGGCRHCIYTLRRDNVYFGARTLS